MGLTITKTVVTAAPRALHANWVVLPATLYAPYIPKQLLEMKLTKIDNRMKGAGVFQYPVDVPIYGRTFADVRKWCTDTYGETVECDYWGECPDIRNPLWSWERVNSNKVTRCRIFLLSDKEANWFSLKWCNG